MTRQGSGMNSSSVASMFGYVNQEDRARWEQFRAEKEEDVGFFRSMLKAGSESMMEFGEQVMRAKLHAAHKIDAQAAFDETHQKKISDGMHSITETVDYEPEDQREEMGPEMDY